MLTYDLVASWQIKNKIILVCITALLVPLHHYLQKMITHKLVEKNKQIRLASARKTIEELEKKV